MSPGRVHASGVVAVAAAILIALAGCEALSLGQDEPDEIVVLPVVQPVAPGTLALAERALSEDRYDDARQLIERVLISETENWEAQLLLAECIWRRDIRGLLNRCLNPLSKRQTSLSGPFRGTASP